MKWRWCDPVVFHQTLHSGLWYFTKPYTEAKHTHVGIKKTHTHTHAVNKQLLFTSTILCSDSLGWRRGKSLRRVHITMIWSRFRRTWTELWDKVLLIISEYSLDMTSQCRQARPSRTLSFYASTSPQRSTNQPINSFLWQNKQKPTTHQHTTRREKNTPSSSSPPLHLHHKHFRHV